MPETGGETRLLKGHPGRARGSFQHGASRYGMGMGGPESGWERKGPLPPAQAGSSSNTTWE